MTEAYLELCETSEMEFFAKLTIGWKLVTIFQKAPS